MKGGGSQAQCDRLTDCESNIAKRIYNFTHTHTDTQPYTDAVLYQMIGVVSFDGFIVEIKLILMLIILELTRMVLRNINLRQFWTNNKNVMPSDERISSE